ncbi:protein LURP-one-related 4-like [Iris pallida]|uniref:Protein LURP-one-related 4-like n=1 Tax=Iris pallida TaxID=29817 RepID=A0AAX6G6K8_IRIPA|nr:protein LURP-one-related 4-like [Iris pallida]
MAKVHPESNSSSPPLSMAGVLRREILTVWMKSLVMNGNGCTVYDSGGRIVYRVDNYDYKCSEEVYLMDHCGKTLTKIVRKKLRVFGRWEGYRHSDGPTKGRKPWFRVGKACRILKGGNPYEHSVTATGCGSSDPTSYKIVSSGHKSEYKIKDMAGGLIAEVKRKHTASGVALGDDVLTLMMEPNVDHLLMMGLVIVCGLINNSM